MDCFVSAIKRSLVTATAVAILLLPALSGTAQSTDEPILAPQNPAFSSYATQLASSRPEFAGGQPAGLVPEPFELPSIRVHSVQSLNIVALPTSYDLRTLNKLTPVRNQGSCGSCWDFAAIGSLESSLMPGEPSDFSENNLKNLAGFDIGCCSGGNRAMSTAYFARWAGPVAETADRYNTGSCYSPASLTPQKHVQDVIFLPNRTSALDNDAIKQAVMTYGAVYTTYYHSDAYYKSTTGAYYYYGSSRANHAVCVVGWDDNFAASNFTYRPPGNGAFLIRNSWGSYWGKSGYFWMSYYDSTLGKTENAVFTAESNTNYDQIYQYDPLGWISNTGYGSNTAWFANVFTATSNSSVAAAGFYAPAPGASYIVSVYRDLTSGPVSSTGAAATFSGTLATAGYHTVQLPSPVPVSAGRKFSVVVRLTTPGYNYPVCLERPYSGYSSKATASTGQSYISSNGTSWTDVAAYYPNTNVCLKAFTLGSTTPTPDPGVLSVSPDGTVGSSGKVGGPFSPPSQTYTLSNIGQTAINWTAAPSQSWISLSSASGTLAAGATINVSASINSAANSLAAGTYNGSITFTNTTNGSGSTTRQITLTVNAAPEPTPGALSVSPTTAFTVSGPVGGPFTPSSRTYTLSNTGKSAISWSAGVAGNWLSLSAASGTLAAGASANVVASVNANASGLAKGTYTGAVNFYNATNGVGNVSVPASLTVTATAPPPPPPPPSGTYRVIPTTYSWIDPSYHRQIYLTDESVSSGYMIPFTFTYYSKPYNRVYVGSNGLLGFTQNGLYLGTNLKIPTTTWPNNAIYPYWDNLYPGTTGTVRIGIVGSAPNRKVVVSWVGVASRYSLATMLTFQAILCERSNDIIFQYQNVSPTSYAYGAGAQATIGIENETGTEGCLFSYNTRSVSNGSAIRFTTQPVQTGSNLPYLRERVLGNP